MNAATQPATDVNPLMDVSVPGRPEGKVAALGVAASVAALFSAAACCVVPLVLATIGVGAAGLSVVVPLHWPLTAAAAAAIVAGWLLYLRRARSCARDTTCLAVPPTRATLVTLSVATAFVGISAMWGQIEAPLMHLLGGA